MSDSQRRSILTHLLHHVRRLVPVPLFELNRQAACEVAPVLGLEIPSVAAGRFRRAISSGVAVCVCGVATAGKITVNWDDNSTNESGFKIERSANGGAYTQIAAVGANTTAFTDTAVAGLTTYAYRIRAYNSTTNSAYSNSATVKTNADGLVATASGGTTSTSTTTTTDATGTVPGRIAQLTAKAVAEYAAPQSIVLNFTVTGASKSLLLRGIGPGLSKFTSATTLPDPKLNVYDGSSLIASNDNWGGTSALMTTFTRVGAFSLAGYSKDAALQRTMSVKSYSAVTNGNYRGLAQAEIYDADTATIPSGRLSKISARATVGTGGDILVAGLVIKGTTNLRLVIRAIGPSLTGVTGVMADPVLKLYRGTTLLRSNDNWGGGSALSSAFVSAGASSLSGSSKDSAMDVTLSPGTYTATIAGVNSTKGVARLEVYEIR